MPRAVDNSSNYKIIAIVVIIIVIALIIGFYIYQSNKVSIIKAQNIDRDIEIAKINAQKDIKQSYHNTEIEKSKQLTEALKTGVETYGNIASKAVDVVGNVISEQNNQTGQTGNLPTQL